ncbi:Pathogenicity locus [Clostridioides difficile]|nr:Pathogenicity locus [Clostridioides difficile]VIG17843.1 Pathogenicity locus [Clostridioides difficile]
MGELQKIPGVGKATEKSLIMLGYTTIKSLKDANPAQMYEKECLMHRQHIDR